MKIIDSPWLAIDIGSDRTHVAFKESETEVQSVETLDNEFDTIFHVSKSNHVISCGRAALEHLESDPGGIVLLDAGQLKDDEPIRVSDGRTEVRPTRLFTAMLTHIREYCEMRVFTGTPIPACALAVPRRNDQFRRAYRKLAVQAGFRQVLFRDALLSAGHTWRHVWGEECRYLIICNLAASVVSFSLLRSRHGGFERIEKVPSGTTLGIDQIDRIILETAYATSNRENVEMTADRLRLKNLRRHCNFDSEEQFQVRLGGRNSRIYTSHFLRAAQILAKRIESAFRQYQLLCQKAVGEREIPVAIVGGGANVPANFDAIDLAAEGKVYWWGGAEETVAVGTALNLLPLRPRENPTKEEAHFYQLFLKAEADHVESQYYLGKSLELGHGTAKSPEEAFDWLLLAADNGFDKAKYRLAKLIHRGQGTIHDENKALRLLRESAEEDYYLSQHLLGVFCHETGKTGEALEWLQKAAAHNFPPAIIYIEKHFGAEALPQITKSIFADAIDDSGEHAEHFLDSPTASGDPPPSVDQDSQTAPPRLENEAEKKPPKKPMDPQVLKSLLRGTGISLVIFLLGAVLLYLYRVENPVAEYGSYGLFACAAGAAVLSAASALRLFGDAQATLTPENLPQENAAQ